MAIVPNKTLGEKLLSLPKTVLYLLLILATAVPLFIPAQLPNTPKPEAVALYDAVMALPEGSTIIIQSDWTESTRGENGGLMDAMLRIIMRRKIKFAILGIDPQSPQVARNLVNRVNKELPEADRYKKWEDWVELGFFPNAEGLGKAISADIRKALGSRRDAGVGMPLRPVFESPVLSKINKIEDADMYLVVTASKSIVIAIERFSRQTKMAGMVTGVMGPETLNYYLSGQLVGLAVGLKGAYDLETLMSQNKAWEGQRNLDKGPIYILSLHVAIGLLILMVVLGNVGVFLTRGQAKR